MFTSPVVLYRTRKVYEQSIRRYFFVEVGALIARIFPRTFINTEHGSAIQYVESVAKGLDTDLIFLCSTAAKTCYVFLRIDDARQLTDSVLKRSDKGKPGKSQGRKAAGPRFLREAKEDLPKGPKIAGLPIS